MAITIKEASNTPLAIAALAKGMADSYVNYSGQRMQDKQYQQTHQYNLDNLAHSKEMEERRMKELEINGAWSRGNQDTLTANTVTGTNAGIANAKENTQISRDGLTEQIDHNDATETVAAGTLAEGVRRNNATETHATDVLTEQKRSAGVTERLQQETLDLEKAKELHDQQELKDPDWKQKIDYAVQLAMQQAPGVDENQVRYAIGMHMLDLTQNNNNTITNDSIMSLPYQQILGQAGIVATQNGDKVSTGDAAVSVNGPSSLSGAALEPGSSQNNPVYPQSPEEYASLAPGTWIKDKLGLRQKPADDTAP
jgi:hypothetical protein